MSSTDVENQDVPTSDAMSVPTEDRGTEAVPWRRACGRHATIDALAVGLLILVAAIPRYVLPADGFFFDDAWQAAGVVKSSLRDLPFVGQTQPGFAALLWVLTGLFGSSDLVLIGPTLVAGAVGPALLFVTLRRLGSARAIAFLTAIALAGSEVHIQYSGRVKTYTIDILVVLALVAAVSLLGRRPWTPRTAALWVLACGTAASFSSTSLITAGCAGAVLALHPCRDRWWRWIALAGQGMVSGALLLHAQRSVNTAAITDHFRTRYGMIGHNDPLDVPRRTAAHLFHVVESLVDLPTVFVGLVLLVSLAGVAWMALAGPDHLVGRFLALCLTAVVVGSIAGVVPMGSPATSIDRVNLWLFPILAIGFARSVSLLADLASPEFRLRVSGAVLALALVVGSRGLATEVTYPVLGTRTATAEVLRDLDDRTVVWLTRYQGYGFALEGNQDVSIVRQTDRNVGFAFEFDDPRIVAVLHRTTDAELSESLAPEVNRVHVVSINSRPDKGTRTQLAWHLALSGFEVAENRDLGGSEVATWVRSDGG